MNSTLKTILPYLIVFIPLNLLALVIVLAFLGKLKDSPPYFFAAGAVISFCLVIVFAFQGRNVIAMSVLFFLCVVFSYFPQLDSISAGWVNVKLSKNLDRAEEILGRLKTLAGINATVTYSLMAWSNRWNGMPLREKQNIADQIDSQLKSYGVPDNEIASIKGQYVSLIGYDLSSHFEMALSQYFINRHGSKPMKDSDLTSWSSQWNAHDRLSIDKLIGMNGAELTRALKAEIPKNFMESMDIMKFDALAERIGTVHEGCIQRRGYTAEAINFLQEYTPLAGDDLVAHVLK
jgi:hypothetical protein